MKKRRKIDKKYFCHKSSYIDKGSKIGRGTRVWHFSHILQGSTIGNNCNIGQNVVIGPEAEIGNNVKVQNNVSIYKGVTIEDDVFCGPSCVFTNVFNPRSFIRRMDSIRQTVVRKGATIGANATVVCGVEIGKYAFVGAGSVVTKDIRPYALCYGNPASSKGWICECGVKLEFKGTRAVCRECDKKYRKNGMSVYRAI